MYTSDRSGDQETIFLKNYRRPAFLIEHTDLWVELGEQGSEVRGTLDIYRNPHPDAPHEADLVLDIDQLEVLDCVLDGRPLDKDRWQLTATRLRVEQVPDRFQLVTRVRIHPESNTSLMGLYKSRTMFCTQCEAEGFRKITPYLDRPDVLSRFTTTLVADKAKYPVLLSNGNLVEQVDLDQGRHRAAWEDPFPKPSYLFAMVAGSLSQVSDRFVTCTGREIDLRIYVEPKDLDKCAHALTSLKRAMRWDEETYGREYDLDIFMIVAVDDFNMGAMENKGLNIFNTSAVLTNPAITTDQRFQWVEAVVAHEYFHNWSGNRVTCRDWFQLSLKEGFTVFRDSEFSADMNSRTVKRIETVRNLRAYQFAEDAGPLAHPVQPPAYQEINNFYTQTVYEKGAEVVRMQATLLGPELFRQGTDRYFERFDGQAVTIEDFVGCMQEVSGRDFDQFMNWYRQAGTPLVEVDDRYDADRQSYELVFRQSCPATPGQPHKEPFMIPIRLGLVGHQGDLEFSHEAGQGTELLFELTQTEQRLQLSGVTEKPVPSLLRDFSAPVRLNYAYRSDQLIQLMRADTNGFNRWNASQDYALSELRNLEQAGTAGKLDKAFIEAVALLLTDDQLDPAMVALMILLPSMETLVEGRQGIDLEAIWQARESAREQLAKALGEQFKATYMKLASSEAYAPTAAQIARRSLKNICIAYWLKSDDPAAIDACHQQFMQADNMTDVAAALGAMVNATQASATTLADQCLEHFYQRWQAENLVVTQWLAMQASRQAPGNLARVQALLSHPAYDAKNPNKVRSLIGGFCTLNPDNFHHKNGSGYEFLAQQVVKTDSVNPQVAARLVTPLTKWKNYAEARSSLMRNQLAYIASQSGLSRDLREVVDKSL